MRISKKIGLSFFITFLLVIFLGVLSIYSLRQTYTGLEEVFGKDLPASRSTYRIAISLEGVLSELNNFLITGNENFKIGFKHASKQLHEDISALKKYILKEDEKASFRELNDIADRIDKVAGNIFEDEAKMMELVGKVRAGEVKFRDRLSGLINSEEDKMLAEKDLLLIQARYIPASHLLIEANSQFSNILNKVARFIMKGQKDNVPDFTEDISRLEKGLRDYKNYYGYTLSDRERSSATELIELSSKMEGFVNSIVDLRKRIDTYADNLQGEEGKFVQSLDKIISLKKNGISSKLGIGATLTEDIPAIHNISEIEQDIAESWRLSGMYILNGDRVYMDRYRQLKQNIERKFKDYGRHARLRGTETVFKEMLGSYDEVLTSINSTIEIFDKKQKAFSELASIKMKLENDIGNKVKDKDLLIKEAKQSQMVLGNLVPSRWILMRLQDEISNAYTLILDYLNERRTQYKDMYSEIYFNMKKHLNRYRNLGSEGDKIFIQETEAELDKFNAAVLAVIGSHEKIMKERGWALIKLEENMREKLDSAISMEMSQIEKNKAALKQRIALINTLIFLVIGGVAVIAIFIFLYTTNSITNPIQELYRGAEVIGRGNLDHRLDIKTGDEIQDLAEGFNNMARELKELYTNLENKVKERTAQLAEANKALEFKNKELDDFTYIVSHDLKEPLRGVKAFTKLLIEDYSDRLDREGKEHLKTISESSSRMTRLIEDLLNLSRIGRIRNIEKDVDLNVLLADVKKNLAYSLEERNVDLKIAKNFPKVTCDKIRISEVFLNLISNAIKYSKKDVKPVIEIGYSDQGNFYQFYVRDNGIGIEKQYYEKVFQIFQRLHAKGEYEGTGAGLTIVKKIIENHGGKIWVESKVGVGSTFYFTLPKGEV